MTDMHHQDRALAQKIGGRIRSIRNHHGDSLADLAKVVGTHATQVSAYESCRNAISVARLVRIARHYQVPLAWFVGENDTFPPAPRIPSDCIKAIATITKHLENRDA